MSVAGGTYRVGRECSFFPTTCPWRGLSDTNGNPITTSLTPAGIMVGVASQTCGWPLPGTFYASIVISPKGGTVVTIPVTLVVTAPI